MDRQLTTLILTHHELSRLLTPGDYINGVAYAFQRHGLGQTFGTSRYRYIIICQVFFSSILGWFSGGCMNLDLYL